MARWKVSRLSRIGLIPVEQGVATQAQAKGLQRNDVGGGDVSEVDLRAELTDQLNLQVLVRRFEDQPVGIDARGRDLVDQTESQFAVRPANPALAALSRFGD